MSKAINKFNRQLASMRFSTLAFFARVGLPLRMYDYNKCIRIQETVQIFTHKIVYVSFM